MPGKKCYDHLGREYESLTSMAKAYGLTRDIVKTRLAKGDDIESALRPIERRQRRGPVKDHLGNEYKSMAALAKAYGIPKDRLVDRLTVQKMNMESALEFEKINKNAIPCKDHLGNEYPSKTAMAAKYGTSVGEINRKLKLGKTLSEILSESKIDRAIKDENGNEYPSISAMARAKGISASTISARIRRGTDAKQINSTGKLCGKAVRDHLGNEYPSMKAMAEKYNSTPSKINQRLKLGWTLEAALTEKPAYGICDHLGNEYDSMTSMADAYGMKRSTLSRRLREGWDLESALTEPMRVPKPIRDGMGHEFTSISALRHYYSLSMSTVKKLDPESINMAELQAFVIRRFTNARISEDTRSIGCVRYPYFEIEADGERYIAHIDTVLSSYSLSKKRAA